MAKTILVVDDSPSEVKLIVSTLKDKGYNLVVATDGEEALERAIQHRPDLVVLDVVLPKRNGFQVCRQLKTAPDSAKTKVIMVSSKSQDSDRFWGLKQGADAYLTKPLDPAELISTVAKNL